jgi:glycine/D-amino acid oxidase-like deaminating enzyme
MRVCIVGAGVAGTLLAWRLAQRPEVDSIDLLAGAERFRDATEFSGGVVRAYERHPLQRRLAMESLAELQDSQALRQWSQFRETGSVYLRAADADLSRELEEVEAARPGTVRLATRRELGELGWSGLPPETVGVVEKGAGYLSASRLRAALLGDLGARGAVRVLAAALATVAVAGDGVVVGTTGVPGRGAPGGERGHRDYDVVVLAAGAWTPTLLAANGFPTGALRTKSIQYTVYRVAGETPPPFVDESTGLYGRPTPEGGLLLGLATEEWDVAPGRQPTSDGWQREAAAVAGTRLPHLALLFPLLSVRATDCYCDPPVLSLRPVPASAGSLWTFTGGSGGSVKTALAASRDAAERLIVPTKPLVTTGA